MAASILLTTSSNAIALSELLHSVFGFARFRANQEEVCRAAIEGRDLLLVMPTGAGKSLCYQLPAIARGGTALVISPLIALMDDQAAKLASLGQRVARIHSGVERMTARRACQDYLDGSLQFLFIAPERLRVPGFPEMLAKKKLSLIAVDEAHCISQWGHDFRPDYRMLGQYLPRLRGQGENSLGETDLASSGLAPSSLAPILALTATATPTVQADILAQLGMVRPAQFIHGFRRDNLAIEVVQAPMPDRAGTIASLLADPAHRPAIVYATSRKQAENLAAGLSPIMPAAAYHAGLDAETRERVQTAFQQAQLEVVVATIAFGMGIDKADIRTVIHAGLPATLEGYYQEIGRAGRDAKPSRVYLMHSYADQRTHDFFLTRDYPPTDHLEKVFRLLGEEPQLVDDLRGPTKLDEEAFDKALEKLEIHGGAKVDFGGSVRRGGPGWKKTYTVQAQHRAEQFSKVLRYTEQSECRMSALVRHFGDLKDAGRACGICDVCDPAGAVLRLFRHSTVAERALVQRMIDELRPVDYIASGTLQRKLELVGRISREEYNALLDAMVRAGLLEIEESEFEKDGEIIRYRKLRLTEAGLAVRASTPLPLLISDGVVEEFGSRAARGAKVAKKSKSPAGKVAQKAEGDETPIVLSAEGEAIAARLRAWRAGEAKRLGVPAYVVLHDRTLIAIANERPTNPNQLLSINGMGPAKVEKFGEAILDICLK